MRTIRASCHSFEKESLEGSENLLNIVDKVAKLATLKASQLDVR